MRHASVLCSLLLLCGCPESHRTGETDPVIRGDGGRTSSCTPSTETCDGADEDCDGLVDEGDACCTRTSLPVTGLDVLFVIDDSNSMTEEQASLAVQLPRIVHVLATGDLNEDGTADFPPPSSVHFGVVTTDMGTGGFTVPTCAEPNFGDDGVLRTLGNVTISGCMGTYPSFVDYRPMGDDVAAAEELRCVAQMGTGGCGFEQQLDAMLKAVTPSSSPVRFAMGTTGHGDRENASFARPDAMLAVVILTDEEDCSAADPELFNPSSPVYTGNLNLRCFSYPEAVHPIERYVEGLLSLKSDPSQIFYALIAGVPGDLTETDASYDAILADPRMQERVDPGDPNRLAPSCNVPGRGLAFPPRRLVGVARGLHAQGGKTIVGSICQADFSPVTSRLLASLAEATRTVEVCR